MTAAQRKQWFSVCASLLTVHVTSHASHTLHYAHTFHTCAHMYTHTSCNKGYRIAFHTYTHTHTHTVTHSYLPHAPVAQLASLMLCELLQNTRSSSLHFQTLLTALTERKLCIHAVGCFIQRFLAIRRTCGPFLSPRQYVI